MRGDGVIKSDGLHIKDAIVAFVGTLLLRWLGVLDCMELACVIE